MKYLKLFENHVVGESYPGSEVLNIVDKDPMDVIMEYAPWYSKIEEDQYLYRGLKINSDYIIVDPSKNTRKPLGDNSYLNLMPLYYDSIMNGSEDWINFSGDNLRKHSIFVSNSEPETLKYGNTYRVIPLERSEEFIKASKSDTLKSFEYLHERFGIDLIKFMDYMETKLGLSKSYNSYEDMSRAIDSVDGGRVDEFISILAIAHYNINNGYDIIKNEINKAGSLSKWIDKMFSPELNGFSKVKYDENMKFEGSGIRKKSVELWTGGKCLLVREGLLNGVGSALDKEY